MAKLCEVLKYHFLRNAAIWCMLQGRSHRSDVPSLKCHVRVRDSVSGKSVVRKGKDLIDFLRQRDFAKSITTLGRESIALIIEDPNPLEHGTCAWPCFEAVCTFLPLLRRFGARSVSVARFLAGRCGARFSGCSSSDLTCSTIARHKVMSQRSRIWTTLCSGLSALAAAHTTYRSRSDGHRQG